jgi:hypothetical protein
MKNSILAPLFLLLFSTLLSSTVFAEPTRLIHCTCYQEKTSLWEGGAKHRVVSGCASGRGASECSAKMQKKIAAIKAECDVLIGQNCPQQPKCLKNLEKEILNLDEKGYFARYQVNEETLLVSKSDREEVYAGVYDDYTGEKTNPRPTADIKFNFEVKADGTCGSAQIDIQVRK